MTINTRNINFRFSFSDGKVAPVADYFDVDDNRRKIQEFPSASSFSVLGGTFDCYLKEALEEGDRVSISINKLSGKLIANIHTFGSSNSWLEFEGDAFTVEGDIGFYSFYEGDCYRDPKQGNLLCVYTADPEC